MPTVRQWLDSLGIPEYAGVFEENDVDWGAVRALTDADLRELGVSLGHRKRILDAIRSMDVSTQDKPVIEPSIADLGEGTAAGELPTTGERRHLTVVFCDLVGSTALSSTRDPEEYRAILEDYYRVGMESIQRFDGFVAQIQGDGIVAYFGYPFAHEGQGERALQAGLSIVDMLSKMEGRSPEKLQVRVGIATGLVVVPKVLSTGKSAVGEAPNVAARLQTLADPGEVVVDDATRALACGMFEFADRGSRWLKGLAQPVRVWSVLGPRLVASRFEAATRGNIRSIIGREQELALLLACLETARGGEGQVVLLQGEPGIGKSRTVRGLRDHTGANGLALHEYQCSPYHLNSALYPIASHIERSLGFTETESGQSKLDKIERHVSKLSTTDHPAIANRIKDSRMRCDLLARVMSLEPGTRSGQFEMSPQRQKDETIQLMVELVAGIPGTGVTVILFEDVHWADPSTLEVLDALVKQMSAIPVLLLITHRPEFSPEWLDGSNVTSVTLRRLSRSQGAQLVLQVAEGGTLSPDMVQQIVDKADGVPLFLEELTKAVLEAGPVQDNSDTTLAAQFHGRRQMVGIPSTLRDSLSARLDKLMGARAIAQVGACIGREFSYELIREVIAMPVAELDDGLARLIASELVSSEGVPPDATYTFRHALIQDAAYESLLRSHRKSLHEKIAHALEKALPGIRDTRPELLAHHYSAASMRESAIECWIRAGQQAHGRIALQEAIAHFERALTEALSMPANLVRDRYELELRGHLGMSWIALQGWAHPAVAEHLEPALKLEQSLTPGTHSMKVLWGLWVYRLARGQTRESLGSAMELIAQGQAQDDDLMLQAGWWAAVTTYYWLGEFEQSIAYADRILAQYDPQRHRVLASMLNHDPKTVALQYKASSLAMLGFPDSAVVTMHAAVMHARERGHAFDYAWALFFAIYQLHATLRDIAAVDELLGVLTELAREQHLVVFEKVLGPYAMTVRDFLQGADSMAATRVERLIPVLAAAGVNVVLWEAKTTHAKCAVNQGQPEAALAHTDEVMAMSAQPDSDTRYLRVEVMRVRAMALRASGNLVQAERTLCDAIELARTQKAKWWELRVTTEFARLMHQAGRFGEGISMLETLCGWFEEGRQTPDFKEAEGVLTCLRARDATSA